MGTPRVLGCSTGALFMYAPPAGPEYFLTKTSRVVLHCEPTVVHKLTDCLSAATKEVYGRGPIVNGNLDKKPQKTLAGKPLRLQWAPPVPKKGEESTTNMAMADPKVWRLAAESKDLECLFIMKLTDGIFAPTGMVINLPRQHIVASSGVLMLH